MVVGLGRVGLPTAVLLAESGLQVLGVDAAPGVREAVWRGEAAPSEPGLDARLREARGAGRLTVGERAVEAPSYVICVPTPLGEEGHADLSALFAAVGALLEVAPGDALVVIESTVPVGTTEAVAARLREGAPGRSVACAPERVLPGRALHEIVENPRLVGGVDAASAERAAALLGRFARGPIDRTDARTAELCKLVENASRDVALAFANEVAGLAEAHGLDVWRVRELVNRHPRVAMLRPGVGVGGHCLAVDPHFLVQGRDGPSVVRAARALNDGVPARVAERVLAAAREAGVRRVGCLGLTYKADVDDLRNSPALEVARRLASELEVVAADPWVEAVDGLALGTVEQAARCPVVAVLVGHEAFRGLRFADGQVVLDLCGVGR